MIEDLAGSVLEMLLNSRGSVGGIELTRLQWISGAKINRVGRGVILGWVMG